MTSSKKGAVPPHAGAGRPLGDRPEGPGTAFANFLIDFLPTSGMTNDDIASTLGYARPNIVSMWKTAKTKVTVDALWGLSEMLKVDMSFLLALYFEQYTSDNYGGVDHFPEIVALMARTVTSEEFEAIEIMRKARRGNSFPLTGSQKSELKKLFAVDASVGEGALKPIDFNFSTASNRNRFARRGHPSDLSVSEIDEARARSGKPVAGSTRVRGKKVARARA